jgi:hypothetical protein
MASPQASQGPGKKRLGGQPQCPPKVAKGSILVEVRSISALSAKKDPIAGVKVEVTAGPAKPGPQTTPGNGRVNFDGLDIGYYTVGVKIEGGLRKFYDVDPAPGPQTKGVIADRTTVYYFELRYYQIAFFVTYADNKAATGIEYELRVKKITGPAQQLDANWSAHASGVTPNEPYKEDYVPKGRYQLRLKIVTGAVWPKPQVLVGEAVDLHADVTGFDDETAGSFEIFDARNLKTAIHSVPAKVSKHAMKATWTPQASELADLKSGWIVYQAKVSKAQCFSGEAKVVSKVTYDVVDKAGKTLNTHIMFHFSGGETVETDSAAGKAEVLTPWGQSLTRLTLSSVKLSRVEFDDGKGTPQKFLLPK